MLIVQAIRDPHQRTRKLCEILETCDDDLLPVFCQALIDTRQRQVARLLGFQGSSVACSVNSTLVLFSDHKVDATISVCASTLCSFVRFLLPQVTANRKYCNNVSSPKQQCTKFARGTKRKPRPPIFWLLGLNHAPKCRSSA